MNEQTFEQLNTIEGISGISILDDMGEVIVSNIQDKQLNELAGFLSGINSMLAEDSFLGEASSITLKSPSDETFIVRLSEDNIIASTSSRKLPNTVVDTKIKKVLEQT